MDSWIDFTALGKILVVGLLAGAGLPALFAVGLRLLSVTTDGSAEGAPKQPANPTGLILAGLCFAVIVAAIGYGIYLIVTG
jgi:hypothetical protein